MGLFIYPKIKVQRMVYEIKTIWNDQIMDAKIAKVKAVPISYFEREKQPSKAPFTKNPLL